MMDLDFTELKKSLEIVCKKSTELQKSLESICHSLAAGELVHEGILHSATIALETYLEHSRDLLGAVQNISVQTPKDLNELQSLITKCEQQQKTKQLVYEYLYLSSDNTDTAESLNESKQRLASFCSTQMPSQEELLPYFLVCSNVVQGGSDVTDSDFDTIYDSISKKIAHAVQKERLYTDRTQDISEYTKKLCEQLQPEDISSVESAAPLHPDPSAAEVSVYANNPKACFHGAAQAPSHASFWLKEIKGMLYQHPESPRALLLLGHEKLLPAASSNITQASRYIPSPAVLTYLTNRGYLARLNINSENLADEYLSLTAKGWACFEKSEIQQALSSDLLSFFIPKPLRINPNDWTPLFALRAVAIQQYYNSLGKNYVMYKQTNTQLAVANAVGDECITLCTALFEKSTKKRDYQGIAKIANRMEPAQKLALLVHKETDIWYLSQELQEYINPSNLLFTLTQEPGVYYDSKGRLVSDFS